MTVILGEGYVYVELIADAVTDDLLLEAGDECAGAELERIILALAAVELFIVNITVKVNLNGVAHFCCAVGNVYKTCVSLSYALNLSVDHLVGDGGDDLICLDALIILNLNLGLYECGSLELNVALAYRNDLEFGAADELGSGFLCCILICLGQKVIDGILIEYALAVHLFDYAAGSLTLTEAGNCHAGRSLLEHLSELGIKLCLVDGKFDLNLTVVDLCYFLESHVFLFPPMRTYLSIVNHYRFYFSRF